MDLQALLGRFHEAVPTVPTTPTTEWEQDGEVESRAVAGSAPLVPTVPTVPTEIRELPANPTPFPGVTPTPTAPLSPTPSKSVGTVGTTQQTCGFEAFPHVETAVGTVGTAPPPWRDDRAWCGRIGHAGLVAERRVVLRAWVDAAGGWSDAAAVYLPDSLPRCPALGMIGTHAHALGLDVVDDPDTPEAMASFREPPRLRGPVCEHCRHCSWDPGPKRRHVCAKGGLCLDQRQGDGRCGPAGLLWAARS